MEDMEFKSILRHLGQDVSYAGLRLRKEIQKCILDLDTSHDARKYCQKLAEILTRFSEYTAQYAKNLQEKIKDAGKEVEYEEAIKTLQRVTGKIEEVNCNSCKAKNPSKESTSSGLQNEAGETVQHNIAGVDSPVAKDDVKSKSEPSLSQCSSVHIGNNVKNEEPSQGEVESQVSTSIDVSQNEAAHSPSGSSGTIIYDHANDEDQNSLLDDTVGNSLEISHSEEVETVVDDRTDPDEIFDKETIANSPPIIEDVERIGTTLGQQQQENVANDEIIVPSKDSDSETKMSQQTDVATTQEVLADNCSHDSGSSSDIATKSVSIGKHSTIDESDDSDVEIVADNLSQSELTPSKENDGNNCALAMSPGCESDATVPNLTPPHNEDSDETVVNQPLGQATLSDNEDISDCSQVFDCAKQSEIAIEKSAANEEFDAPTQQTSSLMPPNNEDSDKTVVNQPLGQATLSDNENISDCSQVFDCAKQSEIAIEKSAANEFDAPTQQISNLMPPNNEDSDKTVVNQPLGQAPLSDNENISDCSQVFDCAKQSEIAIEKSAANEEFDAPTQQISNVATSADVNKENKKTNWDSDVDYDAPTQVFVNRSGTPNNVVKSSDNLDNVLDGSVTSDSDAKNLDNVLDGPITSDSDTRGPKKAGLTGITDTAVESERQKVVAEQDDEKLQFFKSLQVVPRSTHSKSKINEYFKAGPILSGEFPAEQVTDPQKNRPSHKDVSEEKPVSVGTTSSGCSDIFGDISGSESSVEGNARNKVKKKLKEKDRKSLLKLISEYYLKRKKEKLALEIDNASDSSGADSKPTKQSPRKRREAKKKLKEKTDGIERASTGAKKDEKKKKTGESEAKRALNFLNDESEKDNVDIQEDKSDSQITETVIEEHSDEVNAQSKDDPDIIDNTDSDKRSTSPNEKDPAQNPNESFDNDSEATQKVDIRKLKENREENDCAQNSEGSSDKESIPESEVVGSFKRKKIQPLPSSQSTDNLASTDSDVCPIKMKTVVPLPNTRSEEGDYTDGNQVVQPLTRTASTDSDVCPIKKKTVVPLPNTQSEEGDYTDGSQVVQPFKKTVVLPMPASQSDLDSQTQAKKLAESNSGPDEGSSDSQPCPKKRRLDWNTRSENEDELIPPSQFKLDDNARDDFLEMLDQHAKDNCDAAAIPAADTAIAAEKINSSDSEQGGAEAEPANSQFKLDDSDRDNLLNLLTDKEHDESGGGGAKKKEEGGEFKLGSADRDELLNLLEGIEEEREQIISDSEQSDSNVDDPIEDSDHSTSKNATEKASENKPSTSVEPSQFKLDEDERDELLNLLSQHIKEGRSVDGSESGSSSDNDDSEKRKTNAEQDREKKESEEVNRDELLALLNEYEEAVNSGKKIKMSRKAHVANKISGKVDRSNLEMDFDLDSMKSFHSGCDEEGSENSVLLDIMREEAVDQPETSKRKPGRPKDPHKEAWEAYQSLLQDDEDSLDTSSSESMSDLDIDDLEMDFSDQERRKEEQAKNANLRKEFGVRKELFVDLEEADISGFDLAPFQTKQGKSRKEESTFWDPLNMKRLCDLSNVLQKRKRASPTDRGKRKKPRTFSSSSDSSTSPPRRRKSLFDSDHSLSPLSDDDSMMGNHDSGSERDSPIHTLSDDDEQERLANALWENIKNSSDERSRASSSDTGDSSEEEQKVKKKRKKLNLGASEGKKSKKEASEDDTSKSGSSTNGSEDDGESEDKEKKDKANIGADLDSSDEEDFVGVRKGRGAWRYDPLLKSSLSSDSDLDSDQSGPLKKRLRKRKERKQGKVGDFSDSDVTIVNSDNEKTPVKKVFNIDDSDDSDFEIVETQKTPQKPILVTDDEDTPNKKGKGRRNIRALVEDDDLAEATQKANNEEKERIKRLQERDKAKEIFTQSQSFASQLSEDETEPLILDVSDDVQIKVHPKITKKLKPHQRLGIQFMWDSCYESIKQLQKDNFRGSGCILAHCMGLGKTLQALALIQTLFSNPVTKTKHVLVVCPLSTVSNWRNEYNLAYKGIKHSHVKLYTIENKKAASQRFNIISKWRKTGGVLVMGYECFGILINDRKLKKWESKEPALCQKDALLKALVDPGPDLIICDEGHLLRNKQSQRTLALNKVKTRKRIVLTGTPLQNNLLEYYYMVHFVKPNLLGTEKEYKTNFVNPINNGQFEDSTAEDIMFMKKRTHCLHKILNKTVQRVEDTELKQYLPKLVDQAVFIRLSDLQVNLYNMYLDTAKSGPTIFTKAGNVSHKKFLADVQILRYICLHPDVITTAEKNSKSNIKEQDVIDDNPEDDVEEKLISSGGWYKGLLTSERSKKLELGSKMLVAISIVEEAATKGDKVLIFAQFHAEMDILETFLVERLKYKKDRDYYRMDGTISPEVRTHMCDRFNNKNNKNVKVFIMSTKVGGLGLNLTAANRVIIMNVNWNPSYDTQSVFRAFRFGQKKAVYVYRLIAIGTMEEKMYQRVVTKLAIAHRVVDKHQITRHYSAGDIQEFYSVRPTAIGEDRPVPNVPEDRVLANLIQKHQFVYRWHEHQALLANRPEEDLDEQQKNAAWEEYNKKPAPPDQFHPGTLPPGMQPSTHQVVNPLAQPGPSSLQNKINMGIRYPPPLMRQKLSRYAKNPLFNAQGQLRQPVTSVPTAPLVYERTGAISAPSANSSASRSGNGQMSVRNSQELTNTIDMINMIIEADTTAEQAVPQYGSSTSNYHPDHNYSLPKNNIIGFRTTSSEDFQPIKRSLATTRPVSIEPRPNLPPPNKGRKRTLTQHRTSSSDDFRTPAKPKFVPRPLFVDVNAPLEPEGRTNSASAQKVGPPIVKTTPSEIRLGSGMTISTTTSNAPHSAAHKEKPSVSIIPQNVHSRDRSVVPNPLNTTLTGLTQNVNNNVAQKTSNNRQSEYLQDKMKEQIKKAIMDASKNRSHQRNRGNMPNLSTQNYIGLRKLHHKLAKPLKSASPKPMVQPSKMKNAGPPLVSISSAPNPVKTTPTIDLLSPEKPSSTLQSPLRSFMEHLHMLQMNMEATQGTATAGQKFKTAPYPSKNSLNAARNLSNLSTTITAVPSPKVIQSTSQGPAHPTTPKPSSVVRVINGLPNQGSVVNSRQVPSSGVVTSQMRINGIPITKVIRSGNVINPTTLKGLTITPATKKVIISQKPQNGRPVQLQNPVRTQPGPHIANSLQRKMVANLNKLTGARISAVPSNRIKNGTILKTYQASRKNGQSVRTSSLPPLTLSQATPSVSKSNKENRNKKRLLLQGPNNSRASGSVDDQSNDGDAENTSGRSISQDMVNTLKKKGVSINYVGKETHKDVIKLD